ncbi:MAG: (Fe-S)-binding protein, partial [Thermodesulfobacteriota bacterium]|nr:(Fe-S)-binding protein [Thermodesulfobacteriota bacterium]
MPKRGRPQPLHLYQLLPGTNCRLCGCNGCFAFAFSLISREKRIEDCPDLQSEAFISSFRKLNELIGKAEIIEGTDFTLDKDICTGCGDC